MKSDESRNLSTQFSKQDASPLLNLDPIDPVIQLYEANESSSMVVLHRQETGIETHVFQHRSVKSWIEDCIFALACSCSIKVASSRCIFRLVISVFATSASTCF